MSGIALKLSSLVIRTLSKPIANFIKRQAHEHDGFRQTCISFAQSLHRVDMRLRLGLLQDAAAIERQVAREAAEAAAKKHKHPTVPTEAQAKAAVKAAGEPPKPPKPPRIRPLSEGKAVETGANFISEAFLFSVAGGLILFESFRSRRKENTRREDVSDRLIDLEESEKAARRALVELEREVLRLRAKEARGMAGDTHPERRILPPSVYEMEEREEREEEEQTKSWLTRIANYISYRRGGGDVDQEAAAALATNAPGPAEKILIRSDVAIDAKHRAIEAEKAPGATTPATPGVKSA